MPADRKFDWDPAKAAANHRKHRVRFEEASSVFDDRTSITTFDPLHSQNEDRFVTIGFSQRGRLLVVIHTDEGQLIRIISARKATRREAGNYDQT